MRARLFVLFVSAALAAGSCTSRPASRDLHREASIPAETVLLDTADGPLVVDVPAGDVLVDGRDAVASADGARLYASSVAHGRTTIRTIDAATGSMISTRSVRGRLQARVVSSSGTRVALTEPLAPGADAWTPVPRTRTEIVVAGPDRGSPVDRYHLAGNFEPEAFSSDGRWLFLIEYQPADAPELYRVTMLDLRGGTVLPAFGPAKSPTEAMPGTRLEQVPAVDGSQLFTLYTSERPGFAPHDAPVPANAIVSFIHVLSLADGWAHCVTLPKAFWHQPASAEAMAVSPDGATLYLVDADKGLLMTMDTATLQVSEPRRVALPAPGGRTTATVVGDGSTLFVGTAGGGGGAVTSIDTSTFRPIATWSTPAPVSGLGTSLDGARLYVGVAGGLEVLSASTGHDLGDVVIPTPAPIEAVSAIVG